MCSSKSLRHACYDKFIEASAFNFDEPPKISYAQFCYFYDAEIQRQLNKEQLSRSQIINHPRSIMKVLFVRGKYFDMFSPYSCSVKIVDPKEAGEVNWQEVEDVGLYLEMYLRTLNTKTVLALKSAASKWLDSNTDLDQLLKPVVMAQGVCRALECMDIDRAFNNLSLDHEH